MEPASNLQTPSLRRKNRAAADHLTLAPLTTLLPREEYDTTALSRPHTSYIQGRSAPTTPVILSHSPPPFRRPSRDHSVPYSPARAALTKSKSSIQLPKTDSITNTTNPNYVSRSPSWRARSTKLLLHVGALIASEARDAKGQGWLVTRANSTSSLPDRAELAITTPTHAQTPVDENDLTPQARILHHRQQRWERDRRAALSAQANRRGSRDYSASASASALPSTLVSPVQSHFSGGGGGSRSRSRRPMTPAEIRRAELLASMEDDPQVAEDYFGEVAAAAESSEEQTPLAGTAFVNIDMELEFGFPTHDEDEILEADEEYIRKLTKQRGVLAWIVDKMMGREYEEDEEEEDPEEEVYGEGSSKSWEEEKRERDARRAAILKSVQNSTAVPLDERPPKEDGGLLSDAAWLFNVAKNSLLL
ncbi:predicted protein [Chaetomium globosum CBS 148.51]|uniref:Uncharacterized protein n=1 Tax=Chaetomium globosum (strain ATCC 6205 / CBS 148.51 / DSM 1962 / NBRC 6347 / NRRL 1970) TaxID=306901 RepID=Q2GNR0_CHAGB|nr:uncharacterized protein CHGG_10394 [Chaetomium globosum CBS 148.51]EAQ83990.1 predicted protein [Chaetomium globosum CBS 148.51]